MSQAEYNRRKKSRTPVAVILLLMILLVFAAAIMFFRVENIVVEGAAKYSDREIITASGVEEGGMLALIGASGTEDKICAALPYISCAEVTKIFPSTVIISVSESVPVAYISLKGTRWMLDGSCRVLEETRNTAGLIELKGLTPDDAVQTEVLSVSGDNKAKLGYASDILTAILENDLSDHITWLDVSNISAVTFDYDERFTVDMGSGEDASYKLIKLKRVVEKLADDDVGMIDISNDGETRFTPK